MNENQTIQLEASLLATILRDPTGQKFYEIYGRINSDNFLGAYNRAVFNAIELALIQHQVKSLDIPTLVTYVNDQQVADQINQCYNNTPIVQDLESASGQILSAYRLRKFRKLGDDICFDVDSGVSDVDLAHKVEQEVFKISQNDVETFITPGEKIDEYYKDLSTSEQGHYGGFSTYIPGLDRVLCGLEPGTMTLIAARPSVGKCHGIDTPILMYDGTIKMVQDIKIGDQLMGDDSTPRNVLSLARGREQMYWVRQKRGGDDYRINESHILSLRKGRQDGAGNRGDLIDIPLTEYMLKNNKFKSSWKGYKVKVEFTEKNLPIDPYFLGIWLGDGGSYSQTIWNTDDEIIIYIYQYAKKIKQQVTIIDKNRPCRGYSIIKNKGTKSKDGILYKLKKLNILDTKNGNKKNIPHIYMTSSEKQRLELLAGILDTDGYLHHESNIIEITQKRYEFAKNIKLLCDTLGFKTSFIKKIGTIKERNFKGVYYRINICGDIDRIPLKIPRRIPRPKSMRRNHLNNGITIEKDIIDDYYGFEIDGNHRYLLGDCTVAHNTAILLQMLIENGLKNIPTGFFSVEMSMEQLRERYINYVCDIAMHKMRSKNLTQNELSYIRQKIPIIKSLPIITDTKSALTLTELRSRSRKMLIQNPKLKCIAIDFLQIMKAPKGIEGEVAQMTAISQGVKSIAKDLKIPFIALSQLSRSCEAREDKRPRLSDLRATGDLEQSADNVVFLYRDSYYNQDNTDKSCEAIIAKQRNGPTGVVGGTYNREIGKFNIM